MSTADLPFDRDVDREHADRRRAEELRARRLGELRRELCTAAGIAVGRKRPPGAPPPTERASVPLTLDEHARLKRAAKEAGLAIPDFVRAASLAYAARILPRPTDHIPALGPAPTETP